MRLRSVLAGEEYDCRELYDLIHELPRESALHRAFGEKDLAELFHEWAATFIQFQAGKKVTTPSMYDSEAVSDHVYRPKGAAEVKATLDELLGGTSPDEGGFAVLSE